MILSFWSVNHNKPPPCGEWSFFNPAILRWLKSNIAVPRTPLVRLTANFHILQFANGITQNIPVIPLALNSQIHDR